MYIVLSIHVYFHFICKILIWLFIHLLFFNLLFPSRDGESSGFGGGGGGSSVFSPDTIDKEFEELHRQMEGVFQIFGSHSFPMFDPFNMNPESGRRSLPVSVTVVAIGCLGDYYGCSVNFLSST